MHLGSLYGCFWIWILEKHVRRRLLDFQNFYQRFSEEGYLQAVHIVGILYWNYTQEFYLHNYTLYFILIGFICIYWILGLSDNLGSSEFEIHSA